MLDIRLSLPILFAIAAAAVPAQNRTWVRRDTGLVAAGIHFAFDTDRGRVVTFHGTDTWEWSGDGTRWVLRRPTTAPSDRSAPALAYAAGRQRTVLFGGTDPMNRMLTDTWEWDGVDWRQVLTANSPPPSRGRMVHDTARQRTVWISEWPAETWEYDGADWARAPVAPPWRIGPFVAYDSARQRTVLFGGTDQNFPQTVFDETWEWDGASWRQVQPLQRPPGRFWGAAAFDAAAGRIVILGGLDWSNSPVGDVWEFDGRSWTPAPTGPSARSDAGMIYDSRGRRLMLFGGWTRLPSGYHKLQTDVWERVGTNWNRLVDELGPTSGVSSQIAYDAARDRVVQFGGKPPRGGLLGGTWEWDGVGWNRARPANEPPERQGHGVAYDAARGVVVVFGGQTWGRRADDTWTWNGRSWTQQQTSTAPSVRSTTMCYDAARQRVVLFGGFDGQNALGETWEWDGTVWALRAPSRSPSARAEQAMAYDPVRRRTVLFGGWDGRVDLGDTWEWDGSGWLPTSPARSPSARSGSGMAWDPQRQVIVLFGGHAGSTPIDELWEWDGTDWTPAPAPGTPPARTRMGMTTDSLRQRIVVFGGEGGFAVGHDHLWLLGDFTTAVADSYGSPCGSPTSTPRIAPVGYPSLGASGFALDVLDTRPTAPAAIAFSPMPGSVPVGACTLLVLPPLTSITVGVNAAGFGSLPLRVPFNPAFLGVTLHAQAIVADPAGPFVGLTFSNGLRIRIGE